MYFDTHAHYDDEAFNDDLPELMAAMRQGGISYILNPAVDLESSEKIIGLSDEYDILYVAVGFHPSDCNKFEESSLEKLEKLSKNKKVLAIGEIGLDYYWTRENAALQRHVFTKQLELAFDLGLPVVVHSRDAHEDTLETLSRFKGLKGVMHCYSGTAEFAERLIKLGFYFGFDGPVTYKNARKTLEALAAIPKDRILIETDSPYLSPVPHRGKRNSSLNLPFISARCAEILGMPEREFARLTLENGKELFGI